MTETVKYSIISAVYAELEGYVDTCNFDIDHDTRNGSFRITLDLTDRDARVEHVGELFGVFNDFRTRRMWEAAVTKTTAEEIVVILVFAG